MKSTEFHADFMKSGRFQGEIQWISCGFQVKLWADFMKSTWNPYKSKISKKNSSVSWSAVGRLCQVDFT